MFRNYFKTAFRNLKRNKIYSVINILGLSLGLACAMLIILYVNDEVSYDRFHEKKDHLYRIVTQNYNADTIPEHKDPNTGFLQGPVFHAGVPEIKSYVRIQSSNTDIKKGTDITSKSLLRVDPEFFSLFTFPLLSGNPETCLEQPHSMVLTEEEAKNQFGTSDAVGKTMLLRENDSFIPYTVTAIAKNCPQNSSIKFNILLPLITPEGTMQNGENWFSFFLNTLVLIEPEADISLINDKIQNIYLAESSEAAKIINERYGDSGPPPSYFLQPFTNIHLSKELPAQNGLSDSSNPVYSYILSGIALFILLIACINFINLTVARSIKRAKEIGIRKVVGGNRKQLIFQFLGESFLLCLIAFVLALLMVQLVLPLFNDLANKVLAISYLLSFKLITGYILLFLITALLSGFYPALVLSQYNPVETLYNRFILGGKNYLQKALVVLQFALASFLIIATFIIYSQFKFLTTKDLGYDDSNVVAVGAHGLSQKELALFREKVTTSPDITEVAGKNGGYWSTSAKVNGEKQIQFAYETVDESYIPLLKIKVVKGRNFSREFPSDSTHSVLVNESFVKEAGWKDPIGQVVDFWYNENEKYTVTGVVKDHHYQSLSQKIGPQLFTMKPANKFGLILVKIKSGSTTAALGHIKNTFQNMFPLHPYNYAFRDEINLRRYQMESKWKQIMLLSAVLTIFISCIGLFGLSVLSTEKRTKEIGIRKILGASVNNVVITLSRDFIKLVLIALALSVPVAWMVAGKWLQNYPYRINPGWQIFAVAAVLVIFIALATVSFQAVKAAIANPARSLRTE
ncbi:ABC transporter permease [Abyssalbus ytuae]|uniref:ABC transporter permease n=1 Tax=Abyssalbus ytuae TaxID=2926907 RepID=A0A9E6ZP04_9FLAO|nr:ABC transporter permease [Abyssalbus ytuae]UOB16068.1 ABC transporter permease [Abyssalbus ytuae]